MQRGSTPQRTHYNNLKMYKIVSVITKTDVLRAKALNHGDNSGDVMVMMVL